MRFCSVACHEALHQAFPGLVSFGWCRPQAGDHIVAILGPHEAPRPD